MPRTKLPNKVKVEQNTAKNTIVHNNASTIIQQFELMKSESIEILMEEMDKVKSLFKTAHIADKFTFNPEQLRSTLNNLDKLLNKSSTLSSNSTIFKNKSRLKRSSSLVADDEGYLTAESRANSGDQKVRESRQRTRGKQTTRLSRSVPRNQKTPTFGTITPKVAPDTPQVLLRRPKIGEMALSLQGSPIFTGSVISENTASVTVPLKDGNLLTIQPRRGLRQSQVPSLDLDTKRQLKTLRDNLEKILKS